jgi:hypothetical protein
MTAIYEKLLNPLSAAKTETLRRLYSVVGSMPVVLLGRLDLALIGDFPHAVEKAAIDSLDVHGNLATQLLEDEHKVGATDQRHGGIKSIL